MAAPASPNPTPTETTGLAGLSARGITIRPYRDTDAAAVCEAVLASKAALTQWMPWCHPNYAMADAGLWVSSRAAAWARAEEFDFVVCNEADGCLLGGVGLNKINREDRVANLGYWVRSDTTGRGVASTAARLLARFGLTHLRLRRIEIIAALDNVASQRAAARAGATREGVLRNRLLIHGASHDAVVFSFVPADFEIAAPP